MYQRVRIVSGGGASPLSPSRQGGGGVNYPERKATRERGPLGWAVMGELTKTSGVNS